MTDVTDPAPPPADTYDIEFFWDPVCPFAWITSRWVALVAAETGLRIDWRFISLRLLNKDKDYATEFPVGYLEGHTAGLRMLRVAAAVRDEVGRDALGPLVAAYGASVWDRPQGSDLWEGLSTTEQVERVLAEAGLPTEYAVRLDDTHRDDALDAETELALSRTGREVGTPIITFHDRGDDGARRAVSFFGPVISRVPAPADAVRLWDAVTTLASFPGFAEMKRSLREVPQVPLFGVVDAPVEEDWQGGHRRGHLPGDRD
jgi:2-hydroxychromene-2-carboxylate isomerase